MSTRSAAVTLLLLATLGAAWSPLWAFVGELSATGQYRRWALNPPDGRVPTTSVNRGSRAVIYQLDAAGSHRTNAAAELDAVRAAFDQWQVIPGGALKFEEGPGVSGTVDINVQDGRNLVFWTTNRFVNGGRDNLAGVLSLTYVASFSTDQVIREADIVFNSADFRWYTDASQPPGDQVFVEAVALHEIGHFVGLRHSPVGGATMLFDGDRGLNSQLELSADEVAATRALYPATGSTHGKIQGTVRSGATVIFGAAVFAEDRHGNVLNGTVTRTNGAYELAGLEPGDYRVRVTPLDPAIANNYLVRGAEIASTYRTAMTGFQPTTNFSVTVPAGGTVTRDAEVVPGEPLRIVRLLRPAADLNAPSYSSKPVVMEPGTTRYLGVLTTDPVAGTPTLQLSGEGWTLGPVERRPNALGTLALVAAPVTLAADATPGLRSIRLGLGDRTAWANGFIEVPGRFPDGNRDGLDDRFQRRYWSRFTTPDAGPARDPDGDGFTNAWEYATSTDPTNRLSAHFEILSVRVTATEATIRAQAAAGKRFQLSARETVPGSAWIPIGAPVTASAGEAQFTDPAADGRIRFYRVELLP